MNTLTVGSLTPTFTGSNTVPDPSFETDVSHWTQLSSTISSSSAASHTGSKSMLIAATGVGSGAYFQENTITAGTKKIFRLWVRGDSGSAGKFVQLKVTSLVDNSNQVSVPVMLDASTWKELWCTWVIPNTGNVTYTIQGYDTVNGNNIYVDDAIVDTYILPSIIVSSRRILYNGTKVFLRGSNFQNEATGQPAGVDYSYEKKQLRYDLEDLKAQGVNMIRLYTDQNTPVGDRWWMLDECYRNGIGAMLLMFGNIYNSDYTQATGTANRTTFINNFKTMVTNFKNHPAVIAYGVGSESNFTLSAPNTETDWFTLLDACCAAGKAIDSGRVYYTSNGEVPTTTYDALVPNLDVWGMTIYRGTGISGLDSQIVAATSKAAILSEIGLQCFDASIAQNQTNQSNNDVLLLTQAEKMTNALSGTTYFQMMDDRSDNQQYGIAEVLSTGSSQSRTKRTAWTGISNYYAATTVYDYYSYAQSPNPVLWLKSDTGITSDSNGVSAWADQSGVGGANAVQSTNANKPTQITNVLNGYPVIRFSGNQWMDISPLFIGPNVTIFVVAANKTTIDNNNNFSGFFRNGLGVVDVLVAADQSGNQSGKLGANLNTFNYFGNQKQRQVASDQTGGSVALYKNSSTSSVTTDYAEFAIYTFKGTAVQINNQIRIGAYLDGKFPGMNDIAEIIVYNTALSDSAIATQVSSLDSKYNISSYSVISGSSTIPNFQFIQHQSSPLSVWNGQAAPLPTNEWYMNAFIGEYTYSDGSHSSDVIKQLPYSVRCYPARMEGCYPSRTVSSTQIVENYSANVAFAASETIVSQVRTSGSKFHLSMKWSVDSTHYMNADIVRGSPYLTMNYTTLTPKITTDSNISSINGSATSPVTGTKFKLVLASGQTWILYASSSITFSWSGKTMTASGTFSGSLRLAYMPTSGDESILDTYQSCIPTTATFAYNNSGQYTFTYTTTGSGSLLMMAMPHHMDIIQSPTTVTTQYQTVRGLMTGVVGTVWTMQETLPPITWTAPRTMGAGGVQAVTQALASDYTFTPSPTGTYTDGDIYFYGKEFCKLARIALIADEIGDSAKRNYALSTLKTALNQWLLSQNTNRIRYDKTWGGLITQRGAQYPYDDFTQGWYSDHMYHYGYLAFAAAVISRYDSAWYNTYKNYVNDLVRDYMNNDPSDQYYTVWRHKDLFEGNSWAQGMFDTLAGKNQESTSEAINAYYGAYLWGLVSNNTTLQSAAQLFMAMEMRSAIKYWHIRSTDTIYPSPFNQNGAVGIGWEGQIDYTVFFETAPVGTHKEWIYGIQMLPFTPLSEYYLDSSWVSDRLTDLQTTLTRAAIAHAIVSNNKIVTIVMDSGGTPADSKGYTFNPTVTISAPPSPVCGNLVINPSAEDTTGWTANGNTTVAATDYAYDGTHSIKQVFIPNGSFTFAYQDIPVQPGQTIQFSAYGKITSYTSGGIGVYLKPSSYAFTYASSNVLSGITDWTRVSGSWIVPAGVTSVRLILDGQNGASNNLTAYWDAVMLEVSNALNSYCPVPAKPNVQATAQGTFNYSQGGALSVSVLNPGSGYINSSCGNILQNPSFENSTIWQKGGNTSGVTFPSSDQAYDGSNSCKIVMTNGDCFAYQDIVVTPGETIQFSAYVNITSRTAGGVKITLKPSNYSTTYAASTIQSSVTSGFVRISGSWTVPAGVTSVRMILDGDSSPTLTSYWDAVMFEVSNSLNPYCTWTPLATDPTITIQPSIEIGWVGFIYMYQAVVDANTAWNNALTLTGYDGGNSKTNTLWWIATRAGFSIPAPPAPPPVIIPGVQNNYTDSTIRLRIGLTDAQIENQNISFNNSGVSFNDSRYQFGGLYNQFFDLRPKLFGFNTQALLESQQIVYNQSNATFNDSRYQFGGISKQNQDIIPIFAFIENITPSVRAFPDLATSPINPPIPPSPTPKNNFVLGPGFLMFLTH